MNLDLIHRIATDVFSVSPRYAHTMKPVVKRILSGEKLSFGDLRQTKEDLEKRTRTQFAIVSAHAFVVSDKFDVANAPSGSIAIMNINGFIQKQSDVCTKGLDQFEAEIRQAGKNPNINGVILQIHSGGGSAFGGEQFANFIGGFQKEFGKPIVAYINSMADSAAYEIIAKSPRIFISGDTAEAGSIGTMAVLMNDEKMMEEKGLREIVVRATNSFNKNEEFLQAMEGNTEPLQKNILDKLQAAFEKIVRQGRRGKLDLKTKENGVPVVLTGKTFYGQDIINVGLADEMASMPQVVKFVQKKHDEMNKDKKKSKIKQSMFEYSQMSNEDLTSAISQREEIISSDENGSVKATAQQELALLQREQKFRNLELSAQSLTDDIAKVNSDLEAAQKDLATAQEANTNLQARVEELEKDATETSEAIKQANAAQKESDDKVADLTAKNKELQANVDKYEGFIQKKFDGKNIDQLVVETGAGNDGKQPEGKQQKVEMTAEQKRFLARKRADEIADAEIARRNKG